MDNPQEKFPDIYDYILTEEGDFKKRRIPLASNIDWNMVEHIDRSFTLKNSKFTKGPNDFSRPNRNIILPIANVNYRSEGFDIKDIDVYVNNNEKYHLSLLARKFHARWAKKYSVDTAIDESVESYFDYGLALVKDVNEERPEVIQLQQIAFCDQTDILSGPICLKHQYSIDQLLDMKGVWYDKEIDKSILMSQFSNRMNQDNETATQTPGKYIEIYELHGTLPETWLGEEKLGENWEDTGKYVRQMHIVTFYVDQTDQIKKGICLFKGKRKEPVFKAIKRDNIHGRACGRGGVEELFDSQVWTNYSLLQLKEMLDAASLMILQTTDKSFAQSNKISDLRKNKIVHLKEGSALSQVSIQPQNFQLFQQFANNFEQNARAIGSASDPQLGINPTSGTPLGTTEIVTQQGSGIHEYRRGKIATFWGEIYRDWTLRSLAKEMAKGDKWLEDLTVEELKAVVNQVSINRTNSQVAEMVASGKDVTKDQQDLLVQLVKDELAKGGKTQFLEIMKGELESIPLEVDFNIAGKQKNLYDVVNKLNGVFRTVFSNPGVLQAPGMSELFNNILEFSGFSPIDFTSLSLPPAQGPQMPQGGGQGQPVASPMQDISAAPINNNQ